MEFIVSELSESIGTITFNNHAKRNALSRRLIEELIATLADFQRDRARVVILRAAKGARVWSAGHDVGELPESGTDPLAYDDPLERAVRAIEQFPAPVIALIEGGVWGGACELALVCDVLIGGPTASFAITPAKIGIPYNSTGLMHYINVLGTGRVKEMLFTGAVIPAERAERMGILNFLVESDELESFTTQIARQITANSPLSIAVIKEQLRLLGRAHPLSPDTFERIQSLRRVVYNSHDYQEGRQAFLEKRAPDFKGA
jgi:methylmalonyl-CoA decarboxylase